MAAVFAVPVGPLISIIAIGLSIWLISNSPWGEMRVAGIAVALGLVLYFVWGRGSREARQASAAALS